MQTRFQLQQEDTRGVVCLNYYSWSQISSIFSASHSRCFLLSQPVHVFNSDVLQVEAPCNNPSNLTGPRSAWTPIIYRPLTGLQTSLGPVSCYSRYLDQAAGVRTATWLWRLGLLEPMRQRKWGCGGNPSGSGLYPATAMDRAGGSQSSRACWSHLDGGTPLPSPERQDSIRSQSRTVQTASLKNIHIPSTSSHFVTLHLDSYLLIFSPETVASLSRCVSSSFARLLCQTSRAQSVHTENFYKHQSLSTATKVLTLTRSK